MTISNFLFLGTSYIQYAKAKWNNRFARGCEYYAGSRYHRLPPISGKAESIMDELYQECFYTIDEKTNVCFILRKDQVKDFEHRHLPDLVKRTGFNFELVHKSPDFTNLNYAGNGNYLNFYIYKAVKNV